ncbi:MAG: aldehyde ferredoxin oxidoreductase C-terminal domain-containing protein [Desulfosarcinaceae bacterium]
MHETHGEKNAVRCIGPAGEYRLASASIQASDFDGRPCRAAGRGGLGAVMGARGPKAIIIEQGGKSADALADPESFKDANKKIVKIVKEHPMAGEVMPALGTAGLVAPVNSMGAFPAYNATKGVLDGWEKISGEAMTELIQKRGGNPTHMGCAQCIVHCSNEFVDEAGQYVTSSLEYETIWAAGGMTGVVDLDTIACFDYLCDDIGVDTMNTGVGIAVGSPEVGAALPQAINAKFGLQLGPDDVGALGVRVLTAERDFNRRADLTAEDDRPPEFFYKEPLPPHNAVFSISDAELDTTLNV